MKTATLVLISSKSIHKWPTYWIKLICVSSWNTLESVQALKKWTDSSVVRLGTHWFFLITLLFMNRLWWNKNQNACFHLYLAYNRSLTCSGCKSSVFNFFWFWLKNILHLMFWKIKEYSILWKKSSIISQHHITILLLYTNSISPYQSHSHCNLCLYHPPWLLVMGILHIMEWY